MLGSKERFSSRVDDYIRYRPFYPGEVLDLLVRDCGLTSEWTIADIGAGPGNLARLFLENGNRVLALEPNREMREAGEKLMSRFPGYVSLIGSAEDTELRAETINLITAGQAFHWFDRGPAKVEFKRILKPDGWVALVWNMRRNDGSRFLLRYEELLKTLPEYEQVKADGAPIEELREFFSPAAMREATFANEQRFDLESFIGRVFSSSYMPHPGTPEREAMAERLSDLFHEENEAGEVRFLYDTQVYYGQFA